MQHNLSYKELHKKSVNILFQVFHTLLSKLQELKECSYNKIDSVKDTTFIRCLKR